MSAFRAFLLGNRRLTALLLAAALCMKALIPAGYMIGADPMSAGARVLTMQICADSLGQTLVKQIAIPQKGHGPAKNGHNEGVCAFTALGSLALGAIDGIQLALALLFILALGFAALVPPAPLPISHLRPPLRGPPALA